MRSACLSVASLISLTALGSAATVAVDSLWTDNFQLGIPFTDAAGVALTNGGVANGDGAVIQLGYFAGVSTSLDPASYGPAEWASFTPISGEGSAYPQFPTSMGDGTFGAVPDGFYSLGVTWDTTTIGAPANGLPGLPTASSRIGVRYYDATTLATSTGNNIVTSNHPDWIMGPPSDSPGAPRSASLDARAPSSPTDPAPGLVWEFASNPFQTIPEPSSTLFGLIGLAFLFRRRRN